MIVAVADTHVVTWYMEGHPKLSTTAKRWIDDATQQRNQIAVSSISFVEMVYLVERGRIPALQFTQLITLVRSHQSVFVESPITVDIARALTSVDAAQVPDMPDRIIAATGVYHGVPVISRDGKIRLSHIPTIW